MARESSFEHVVPTARRETPWTLRDGLIAVTRVGAGATMLTVLVGAVITLLAS